MAVLTKQGGRKPVVVGDLTVGYGNYEQEGLPENKHLALRISKWESEYKPHRMILTFDEAETLFVKLGYYLIKYHGRTVDDLITGIHDEINARKKLGW